MGQLSRRSGTQYLAAQSHVSSNGTVIAVSPDHLQCVMVGDGKPPAKTIPPFAASCRAEAMAGVRPYSRCLVDAGTVCWYRVSPFSFGPLCLHPRHLEIVRQTDGK